MNKAMHRAVGRELEEFKAALIYNAKICDWKSFERKAGLLFDYLESVEAKLIRAVFLRVVTVVIAVLLAAGAALWITSRGLSLPLLPYETYLAVLILALFCFTAFFFMDFRIITAFKASRHGKKRERFVKNIEDDFRAHLDEAGCPKLNA